MSSPYNRPNVISHLEEADWYAIMRLLEANGQKIPHEIAHALKKLMYVNGGRGHKDLLQDLKESVWSITKYIEFLEEIEYNPQDLSEEEIEQVIEEHEEQIVQEAFDLDLALENEYCYTRSKEKVLLFEDEGTPEGKYGIYTPIIDGERTSIEEYYPLGFVNKDTLRVNTATDIECAYDILYNELPEENL